MKFRDSIEEGFNEADFEETPPVKDDYDDSKVTNSRENKLKRDLDEFGVDFNDVDSKQELAPSFSDNKKDRIVSINRIAENYEMTLLGRELVTRGESEIYVQKSKAIAGNSFVKLTGALLRSFADESNLIGSKSIEDFRMQFIDAFNKASSSMMRDRTISELNHRNILKLFKDRLWNIGDIITNTKGNMERTFGRADEENFMDKQGLGDRR